jgi:hypothetical protein
MERVTTKAQQCLVVYIVRSKLPHITNVQILKVVINLLPQIWGSYVNIEFSMFFGELRVFLLTFFSSYF